MRMHRKLRGLLAGAAIGGALLAGAATAEASRVGLGADRKLYVIGQGADDVFLNVITVDGRHYVHTSDPRGMLPQRGCKPYKDRFDHAWCVLPAGGRVVVLLGAGYDRARIDGTARAFFTTEVWGQADDDVLQALPGNSYARFPVYLLGGVAEDTLVGSSFREALWGGPGSDQILPGGGADHLDGGHGNFVDGVPTMRRYVRNDAECRARTGRPWDERVPDLWEDGYDMLDLRGLRYGALADMPECRLGYFGRSVAVLAHGFEVLQGTEFNDRLVGDGVNMGYIDGNAGEDWLSIAGMDGVINGRDDHRDTIKCQRGERTFRIVDGWDVLLHDPGAPACRPVTAGEVGKREPQDDWFFSRHGY